MTYSSAVKKWLFLGCILIACMVVIGGVTRLTGSGLSMTEWDLIMGAVPPMNETEWTEAFNKYKQIPEYELINSHMDLSGFKSIFFWEYLHRNWGRMMGLVFFFPFMYFWRKKLITGWLVKRSLLIMAAGGAVGGLVGLNAKKIGGLILAIFIAGEILFYGSLAFLGKEVVLLIRDKIKQWFKKDKHG